MNSKWRSLLSYLRNCIFGRLHSWPPKHAAPKECKLEPSVLAQANTCGKIAAKWTPHPYSQCLFSLHYGAVERVAPTRIKHIGDKERKQAASRFLTPCSSIPYSTYQVAGGPHPSWLSMFTGGYFKMYHLNKESQILSSKHSIDLNLVTSAIYKRKW